MDNIIAQQRTQIEALLAELDTLPTPELIVEVGRLRCSSPLGESGKARMRLAYGGAFAIGKVAHYLEELRAIDSKRDAIGREIDRLQQRARELRDADLHTSIESQLSAIQQAGQQEVTFHFFVICVAQIDRLLPVAARAACYKLPKADRDILTAYTPLRHYFEHLDERLPGKAHRAEVVTESADKHEWRIQIGLACDAQGRIVIGGHPIDVTSRGVEAVESVVRRTWEGLRASALEEMRKHCLNNSNQIPQPKQVRQDLLVSVSEPT